MKTVGIIAEFNPFHNGHRYLFDRAREMGADRIIVVMSGEFVQSGRMACMSKELRTSMALNNGADLVLQLPIVYSTASAEGFAYGALSLLNSLGCVDEIIFGSECGDAKKLIDIARLITENSSDINEIIKKELKKGLSYPAARAVAVNKLGGEELSNLISEPNNILGLEYCKAILKLNSSIKPVAIKRIGAGYNEELAGPMTSATYIRSTFTNIDHLEKIAESVPDIDEYKSEYGKSYPITESDYFPYLLQALVNLKTDIIYQDIDEDFINRLIKLMKTDFPLNADEFIKTLKTRNLTYTHISRALTHIWLKLESRAYEACPYARILGFKKNSEDIFSIINSAYSIPLISKASKAREIVSEEYGSYCLSADSRAYRLFQFICRMKFNSIIIPEEAYKIIIKDLP